VILRFVLWNLADSKTTIQELRRYLRDESADAFAEVQGLRFKARVSDEVTERWGARVPLGVRRGRRARAADPGP
jgi:trans-2,3-dihydro-3-hydroxyanthranilate isomerase